MKVTASAPDAGTPRETGTQDPGATGPGQFPHAAAHLLEQGFTPDDLPQELFWDMPLVADAVRQSMRDLPTTDGPR